MFPPRLLETRSPAAQVAVATIPALLFGIIVGIALDLSSGLYAILLIIAVVGGIGAGFEHRSAAEGAERGLVSGLMFGAGVIAGHHILSKHAKASLPHPEALEVIVTALVTVPLSAIGGGLRARYERKHAPQVAAAAGTPPQASATQR